MLVELLFVVCVCLGVPLAFATLPDLPGLCVVTWNWVKIKLGHGPKRIWLDDIPTMMRIDAKRWVADEMPTTDFFYSMDQHWKEYFRPRRYEGKLDEEFKLLEYSVTQRNSAERQAMEEEARETGRRHEIVDKKGNWKNAYLALERDYCQLQARIEEAGRLFEEMERLERKMAQQARQAQLAPPPFQRSIFPGALGMLDLSRLGSGR